ncbi:RusA family crossover junction endodeoxyribonuclease [Fibrella sp. HMF5335]|uniref:RusA family crossover junction endodeoxyribonuclease n=1 Tax=Fibrella rubiginis TaxID=2817060 RepID=A0A939GBW4_9BACT|nr:RusA family crossover junction endodeoxyribonuclease [Fibrella rubiginis]MBO0936192.1 RusA family crossover junction endodeoxyribonuclease [Fibrella rubiginis]
MYSFILNTKPKSYNSWAKASGSGIRYKDALTNALMSFHPDCVSGEQDMYGLVYHFYKKQEGLDADNLSKPIWDCLRGVLYTDDSQVKLRLAGSFNLLDPVYDYQALDFTGISGDIVSALLNAFETEQHILYVECGTFSADLIRLNLNRDAN